MKEYLVRTYTKDDKIEDTEITNNYANARNVYKEAKENKEAVKVELIKIVEDVEKVVYSKTLQNIFNEPVQANIVEPKEIITYNVKLAWKNNAWINLKRNIDYSNFEEVKELYNTTIEDINAKKDTKVRDIVLENSKNEILDKVEFNFKADELEPKTEEIQDELANETYKLCKKIANEIEELQKIKSKCSQVVAALDKKEDLILHNIENANDDDLSIDMLKEIKRVRKERRISKENIKNVDRVNSRVGNVNKIQEAFDSVKMNVMKDFKGIIENENDWDEHKKYLEINVTENMNVDTLIDELKQKYRRIVYDKGLKKIYAYNSIYNKKIKIII